MVKDTVTSEQKNKQDKKKKKRKGKKKKCKHQHYKPPNTSRTSLVVQWLRIRASNTGGTGSIPGQGTRILHACHMAKKKKVFMYNFFPYSEDSDLN